MKTRTIFPLVFLLAVLSGCEDFLDYTPQGRQTADAFQPFSAVVACYNDLADFDQRQSIWAAYIMGDIISDNAWKGGRSANDQIELAQLGNFTSTPANDALDDIWGAYYRRMFRFNWTIENLENYDGIDPALKARYMAEVKFLRGIHYFWLNRMFNGVPMPITPLDFDDPRLGRSTSAEVYAQVEADLGEAAAVLPSKADMPIEERGRVTKEAAQAFLAKVYLYQQKWDLAETTAEAVIQSNQYALLPEFGEIFTFEGEFSSESVFEINYVETTEATNGTLHGRAQRSPNQFRGWGFNAPTNDLLNSFEPGDPRQVLTILFHGDRALNLAGNEVSLNHVNNNDNPDRMLSRKAFIPGPLITTNNSNLNENLRLMRYAEVLLIAAEAANENGHPEDALMYLEEVRARARNSSTEDRYRVSINFTQEPGSLAVIATTDKEELRDIIAHERRVELALEGERFYDLVRTGQAGTVMRAFATTYDTEKGRNFTDGVHEYFPIPQVEIDNSRGLIEQNNGY